MLLENQHTTASMDKNHFESRSDSEMNVANNNTYFLCVPVEHLPEPDLSPSGPSSTFLVVLLLLFRLLLNNLIIFCIVIQSQMLNEVCGVATVPHSPPTQITCSTSERWISSTHVHHDRRKDK